MIEYPIRCGSTGRNSISGNRPACSMSPRARSGSPTHSMAGILPLLANEPDKTGAVFPWRTRSGVYKWLRPLCKRLGVKFTPHMARHYLGKELNRAGTGLKTIMGALDHSSATSPLRYQDADIEIVREANTRATKALSKVLDKGTIS